MNKSTCNGTLQNEKDIHHHIRDARDDFFDSTSRCHENRVSSICFNGNVGL
jgi:hypothetical protein